MVIQSICHLVTFPKYQLPELQKGARLALQKEGITAFIILNKSQEEQSLYRV